MGGAPASSASGSGAAAGSGGSQAQTGGAAGGTLVGAGGAGTRGAGGTAGAAGGSAGAGASGGISTGFELAPTSPVSFVGTSEEFNNPERGFYRYAEVTSETQFDWVYDDGYTLIYSYA
jgi:hypothetical protein